MTSSPGFAQSNGQIERTIQSVKNVLKKSHESNSDPYLCMLEFINTPLSASLPSSAQLLYSRKLRGVIPTKEYLLEPEMQKLNNVRKTLIEKKTKEKLYYDKNARDLPKLEKGDEVMIQDFNNKIWKKRIVLDVLSTPRTYKCKIYN